MNPTIKKITLLGARLLSLPFALLPARLRTGFIKGLIVLDSRIGAPSESLKRQFSILDLIDRVISERATVYGDGTHPKHRLTRYHDFFVANIPENARVLDVGCGYGAVARSIASRVPGATVTGIDLDKPRLEQAKQAKNPGNLTFIHGDALKDIPDNAWDVVVLSNVLEHIEGRVEFLTRLVATAKPALILIRVPLFERHWHLPMRKELGVNYFSDSTHFIEHTLDEFSHEIEKAGLRAVSQQVIWGEIWAVCTQR